MGFDNRNYHFYLIFGINIPGKEPWLETEWNANFEPLFSKIIEKSPHKKDTGIRTLEYVKENESDKYYKECKLGKLRWDKKSHEKWTLKNVDKREFHHFELWTPLWTICEKNNTSPDIYISISDEKGVNKKIPCQFDTFITIAIAEDVGNLQKDVIIKLSEKFNSKKTVYNKRTWGKGKKDENKKWEFINSIQDTHSFGIYNDSIKLNIHTIEFEKIMFEPYWEIIY